MNFTKKDELGILTPFLKRKMSLKKTHVTYENPIPISTKKAVNNFPLKVTGAVYANPNDAIILPALKMELTKDQLSVQVPSFNFNTPANRFSV